MAAKGQPKSGGRQKGSPNKKTQDLFEKCENAGVDVFDSLLEYVTQPSTLELRFAALKELCQYLYPKRKALEHSGEVQAIVVKVEDYTSKEDK